MSPEQKVALEALVDRFLTADEVAAIEPYISDPNNRNDVQIAAVLSAGRTRVVQPFMVSARGLAAAYPGGPLAAEAVLMKLEAARDAALASEDQSQKVLGSLLRRQLGFLTADGLDFGAPALRSMLDQFAALGILTSQEAANLKGLASVPSPLPVLDVSRALNVAEGRMNLD
ncbi:MAG: hypothetical protein RJA36_3239 [Pseudomonadota bacterium]|jgi:hypothetical protein